MASPSSRQNLIDYCLRQLGHPVLEINIDDDQIESEEKICSIGDTRYDCGINPLHGQRTIEAQRDA